MLSESADKIFQVKEIKTVDLVQQRVCKTLQPFCLYTPHSLNIFHKTLLVTFQLSHLPSLSLFRPPELPQSVHILKSPRHLPSVVISHQGFCWLMMSDTPGKLFIDQP